MLAEPWPGSRSENAEPALALCVHCHMQQPPQRVRWGIEPGLTLLIEREVLHLSSPKADR